jgi:hypothetical protein
VKQQTDEQLAAIVEDCNRINPLRWDQDEEYRLAQARGAICASRRSPYIGTF